MSKVGANAPTHCSVSGKVAGGCFASAIPAERRAKIGPDWVRFAEHQKDRDFVSQNRLPKLASCLQIAKNAQSCTKRSFRTVLPQTAMPW
jgi:hypothetical protein